MITQPLAFLIPTGMVGLVMVLCGSGLRVPRLSPYAVAGGEVVVALLGLNLIFAARQSFLGLVPTVDSVRHLVYVIANGASTLDAYASPVSVNPTHTRAFLMLCGLGVLFAIPYTLVEALVGRPLSAGLVRQHLRLDAGGVLDQPSGIDDDIRNRADATEAILAVTRQPGDVSDNGVAGTRQNIE